MSAASSECVMFDPADLLPEDWKHFMATGPVRTFNPGLLRDREGWLFAYRVVGPDGSRRIAICRLDATLRMVAGSPQPLTDHVRFVAPHDYPDIVTQWFADPRLYRLRGRVFLYWNSGWHEPRNWQFLQEIDPATLAPMGRPRELILRGERQKLEKNWTLFEASGAELHAIYSITPHRVLQFSLEGEGDLCFEEIARTEWSIEGYPANHGGLRGGAPPVLIDGEFWSFCHTVHDGADGYRYAAAAYRFAARRPFAPTFRPIAPLELGGPFPAQRAYARLNPAVGEVIYPCGAAFDGTRWLVSHGINDERCAISRISCDAVLGSLRPALAPA